MSVETGHTPNGEQFAESSGVNPFDALGGNQPLPGEVENQESLQLAHPFDPFNQMRQFNSAYERKQWNELGFHPTEEQNTMVRTVKIAYGIIAEPFCGGEITASGEPSRVYQDIIVHEIGIDQMNNGNNRVLLTDEERDILVKITKSAGIPCNPERKEYFYDEIPSAYWLDKHKRYRTPPSVVDADQ